MDGPAPGEEALALGVESRDVDQAVIVEGVSQVGDASQHPTP